MTAQAGLRTPLACTSPTSVCVTSLRSQPWARALQAAALAAWLLPWALIGCWGASSRRFILQPDNGLPVSSFRGEAGDSHLLRAVLPMLRSLLHVGDVRPALAQAYGMRAWFRTKGLMDADDEPELSDHEASDDEPACLDELNAPAAM